MSDTDPKPTEMIQMLVQERERHEMERDMAKERNDNKDVRYFHAKVVAVQSCIDAIRRVGDRDTDKEISE